MKRLLTFFLLLFTISVKAAEIDSIGLIIPKSYDRPSKSSQTIKSKIKVGVGNLIDVDINEMVNEQIAPYYEHLKDYFPKPGELDTFIKTTVFEGKKNVGIGYKVVGDKVVYDKLEDQKLINFYSHMGNKLIGGIADRILEVEGVTNPIRRDLWVKKLLVPFQECIKKANNSQYDASHCMDALATSMVPSVGIGIVYELSKAKLSSSLPESQRAAFILEQSNLYKDCIRKTPGSPKDVKSCALSQMKTGLFKVTDLSLSKKLKESTSSAAAAKSIKEGVWPGFNSCVQKVGSDPNSKAKLADQFMGCIDNLVINTGLLLVPDKITNNASIKKAGFKKDEISKLSLDSVNTFKECMESNKKNNVRKDEMLATDNCENKITNDVTYKVVTKILAQSANELFACDHSTAKEMGKAGKELLDSCWSPTQSPEKLESCLRKTIIPFSTRIATTKLDAAIPSTLKNKDELAASSMRDFKGCLEKKLPANITAAKDVNALISGCSNKLTTTVAYAVAKGSVYSKAVANHMSETEASRLVKTFVDQKFMKCLGSAPTDEKLDSCANALKRDVAAPIAATKIRASAQGKASEPEIAVLLDTLVNKKFNSCVNKIPLSSKLVCNQPNPFDVKFDGCIDDLTIGATRSIVLSYEKMEVKAQLNTDIIPSQLIPVQNKFTSCVDKLYSTSNVSRDLDECTKQFSLGFARNLGDLKFNSLMKSALGSKAYSDQKKTIDSILDKYNACLDDLLEVDMEDALLDKLTLCTNGLESRGINFISSTVNNWMSTEEKDAATVMVKNAFANFIPCLGKLLPASPYSESMQENADSILKVASAVLAQYIEYSPEDAQRSLDEIIRRLSTDLKDVATNLEARKQLIDALYKNGALDQFLKSFVRGKVKEKFDQTSEEDLPHDLKQALLGKDNFDKIFAGKEGSAIKDRVMEKILKPLLLGQASKDSPVITAQFEEVEKQVVKLLVNSAHFGEKIIKTHVQGQMDGLGKVTKFFAKLIYGKNTLKWEKIRTSEEGKVAEDYIKENILLPKFSGKVLTKEEEKKHFEEADRLVSAAAKKFH